jgi:lipopolysaccharide transport system ATP-binding protein
VEDERDRSAHPFLPIALRVRDSDDRVVDMVRSAEPITVEVEYQLKEPIQGLRVGLYLLSMRGEFIFTSFDTDDPAKFEKYGIRNAGRYVSRCSIPADTLNEGRYALGVNASSYMVKRYFQDERALTFTVDAVGAPGKQWPETRLGLVRPRLDWRIEEVDG